MLSGLYNFFHRLQNGLLLHKVTTQYTFDALSLTCKILASFRKVSSFQEDISPHVHSMRQVDHSLVELYFPNGKFHVARQVLSF